jgi:hypothetical protein
LFSLILIFVFVTWLVVIISIYFVFFIGYPLLSRYFDPLKSDHLSKIYYIEIQDDLASYLVLLSSEAVLQV